MELTNDMTVEVLTELYDAGYSCDGHPYSADVYYIAVRTKSGRVFIHDTAVFFTAQQVYDEDGVAHFTDNRKEKLAKAEKLRDAIQASGKINLQYWTEGEPSYGSDAYCDKYGL